MWGSLQRDNGSYSGGRDSTEKATERLSSCTEVSNLGKMSVSQGAKICLRAWYIFPDLKIPSLVSKYRTYHTMQLSSMDWRLSTFIGHELISPGLYRTKSSTSALLVQVCLTSLMVSSAHFFSRCTCHQWALDGKSQQHNWGVVFLLLLFFVRERKSALKTDREGSICAWTQGVAGVTEQKELEWLQEWKV